MERSVGESIQSKVEADMRIFRKMNEEQVLKMADGEAPLPEGLSLEVRALFEAALGVICRLQSRVEDLSDRLIPPPPERSLSSSTTERCVLDPDDDLPF